VAVVCAGGWRLDGGSERKKKKNGGRLWAF
jgi:hypothetical protein